MFLFKFHKFRFSGRQNYECVPYSYADTCRNIFNTTKTSGHSSLEKYTSHFIRKGSKGL